MCESGIERSIYVEDGNSRQAVSDDRTKTTLSRRRRCWVGESAGQGFCCRGIHNNLIFRDCKGSCSDVEVNFIIRTLHGKQVSIEKSS